MYKSNIDIIIISLAKNDKLKKLTEKAIETCRNSDIDLKFNIIVVESNNDCKPYEFADKTIYYHKEKTNNGFEFIYNHAVNIGLKYCPSDYICICNNDIEFTDHWTDKLITKMELYKCEVGSPYNPLWKWHKQFNGSSVIMGYVKGCFAGWCFMIKKTVLDKICGKLDESSDLWFSDDNFVKQLQEAGINHILVPNSKVLHKGSETLKTLTQAQMDEITKNPQYRK